MRARCCTTPPASSGNAVGNRRIDGAKQGQNLQSDLVAHHIGDQVGTVCHIVLLLQRQILQNILTAHIEQRTQYVSVSRSDACQSVDARAPYQVDEECLHAVVAMMSHTDTLRLQVLDELLEIAITQFASRHLDAYLMERGILFCIEVYAMKGHAKTFAE